MLYWMSLHIGIVIGSQRRAPPATPTGHRCPPSSSALPPSKVGSFTPGRPGNGRWASAAGDPATMPASVSNAPKTTVRRPHRRRKLRIVDTPEVSPPRRLIRRRYPSSRDTVSCLTQWVCGRRVIYIQLAYEQQSPPRRTTAVTALCCCTAVVDTGQWSVGWSVAAEAARAAAKVGRAMQLRMSRRWLTTSVSGSISVCQWHANSSADNVVLGARHRMGRPGTRISEARRQSPAC